MGSEGKRRRREERGGEERGGEGREGKGRGCEEKKGKGRRGEEGIECLYPHIVKCGLKFTSNFKEKCWGGNGTEGFVEVL